MIYGILLAAGVSCRFGSNKLLYPLPDGTPIGVAAARNLSRGLMHTIAAVKSDDATFTSLMHSESLNTVVVEHAEYGISASLLSAINATETADGWVIVLGDMPWIKPETISKVADLLENGADIVVPNYEGKHGYPIGISKKFLPDLIRITGEEDATNIVKAHPDSVQHFQSTDPGILLDIDRPRDVLAKQGILKCSLPNDHE
jgi:molybdenum cofactor cytidylyltransferase